MHSRTAAATTSVGNSSGSLAAQCGGGRRARPPHACSDAPTRNLEPDSSAATDCTSAQLRMHSWHAPAKSISPKPKGNAQRSSRASFFGLHQQQLRVRAVHLTGKLHFFSPAPPSLLRQSPPSPTPVSLPIAAFSLPGHRHLHRCSDKESVARTLHTKQVLVRPLLRSLPSAPLTPHHRALTNRPLIRFQRIGCSSSCCSRRSYS